METTQQSIINTYTSLIKNTHTVSNEELSVWCSQKTFIEHYFYVDLISNLSPLYSSASANELESFSVICLSLLRGLIGFDKLIDNNEYAKFKLGLVNYEIAIKLTTEVFPCNHKFWRDFSEIQACYLGAIDVEKALDNQDCFGKNEFELLSQHKSAYVKIAVSLLSHITNDFSYNERLNDSLMSLHVAMQYIDDIKDFKHDIESKQITYLYTQTCQFLTKIDIDSSELNSDVFYKYMILSGLVVEHYQLAIVHLRKSLDCVDALPIPQYINFLKRELMQTEKTMWMFENSINIHKLKLQPYKNSLEVNKENYLDLAYKSKEHAVSFIIEKITKDNYWESFLTDNGKGKLWVSSFIACQLLEAGVSSERFSAVLSNLSTVPPMKFSFNENTTRDGDSSSFFIQLHMLNKLPLSEEKLASWLRFLNDDGSWCTYYKSEIVPMSGNYTLSTQGWNGRHTCVTSVAALVLISHFDEKLSGKTINYLVTTQQSGGQWPSYWWTSDVYATSFAIQALCMAGRNDKETISSINKACNWLVSTQDKLGCWDDAFYTALAINALLSQKEKYLREIERAIKWLLNNQLSDGSWLTGNVLRIPQPDVLIPSEVEKWRNSPFGYNTITYDNQRSFTASMVVNALSKFIDYKKNHCADSL